MKAWITLAFVLVACSYSSKPRPFLEWTLVAPEGTPESETMLIERWPVSSGSAPVDPVRVLRPLRHYEIEDAYYGQTAIGSPTVGFVLTDESRGRCGDFTAEHIDEVHAILVDGKVVSTPMVAVPILGPAQLGGWFTEREARDLAEHLSP